MIVFIEELHRFYKHNNVQTPHFSYIILSFTATIFTLICTISFQVLFQVQIYVYNQIRNQLYMDSAATRLKLR